MPHQTASRAALLAVAVVPLMGACASLIGLEEGTPDSASATASSGATASGDPSSSATDSTGTGSGSGGDAGSSTSSNSDVSSGSSGGDGGSGGVGGSGGAGGAGGAGGGGSGGSGGEGPLGRVLALPGLEPTRLATRFVRDEVLVLARRRGNDAPAPCLAGVQGIKFSQALVLEVGVDDDPTCERRRLLDGEGLDVTSMHVRYGDALDNPKLTIAGLHGGHTYFSNEEIVAPNADPGTFAVSTQLEGAAYATHVMPEGNAVARTGWAFPANLPGAMLGFGYGGLFTGATSVMCSGPVEGVGMSSYLGRGDEDVQCMNANLSALLDVRVVDGLPREGSTAEGIALQIVPGKNSQEMLAIQALTATPPVPLMLASLPPGEPLPSLRLAVRAVHGAPFYVVVGRGGESGSSGLCVGAPPPGGGAFAALVRDNGGSLGCIWGHRPVKDSGYVQLVGGLGTNDEVLLAAEVAPDATWDLLRASTTVPADVQPIRTGFCEGCIIHDMAMRDDDAWVLGETTSSQGTHSVFGHVLPPGTAFLSRVRYDQLLP